MPGRLREGRRLQLAATALLDLVRAVVESEEKVPHGRGDRRRRAEAGVGRDLVPQPLPQFLRRVVIRTVRRQGDEPEAEIRRA
jgi:hypothetical protein